MHHERDQRGEVPEFKASLITPSNQAREETPKLGDAKEYYKYFEVLQFTIVRMKPQLPERAYFHIYDMHH